MHQSWTKSIQLLLPLFSLITICRIALNWPLSESISTPDSITYRVSPPGPQTFPYEGDTPLNLLSEIDFLGNSIRPWTTNAVFKLLENDFSIVLFQTLFAAFSWAYLILTILQLLKSFLLKIVLTIFLFSFSLTENIYSWEKFILSESLVNSVFILLIARVIHSKFKTISNNEFTIIYLLYFYILVSRPIFGFCLTIVFIFYLGSIRTLVPRATLILLSIYYVFVMNANSSKKWEEYLGSTREGISFSYITSLNSKSILDYKANIIKVGAPSCLFNNQLDETSPWVTSRQYKSNCPKGLEWLDRNFSRTYFIHLLKPSSLFELGLKPSSQIFAGLDLRKYYPFYSFVEYNSIKTFGQLFWSTTLTRNAIIFLSIIVVISFLATKKILMPMIPLLILILAGTFGSLLQAFLMPDEYGRIGYPGSILFNIAPWLLFVLLIDHKIARAPKKI